MGHHAAKLGARRGVEDPADLDEPTGIVRRHARPPAVGVDLDQHREDRAPRLRLARRGLGHLDAVEDDGEVGPAPPELRDMGQLRRHDTDGVEDVGETVTEEVLGLPEGGDGDPAGLPLDRQPDHIDRLGGLDVRPQRHPQAGEPGPHPLDVADEAGAVDHQGGGLDIRQLHPRPISSSPSMSSRNARAVAGHHR